MPPAAKPKLGQAEFDEAVKTNIDDFGMDPEEAVTSATDEFKLQGYDVSGVIKTAGGSDLSKHPIALATQALQAHSQSGASPAQLLEDLQLLGAEIGAVEPAQAAAIADKVGTPAVLVAVVKALPPVEPTEPLVAALGLAARLMGYADLRFAFTTACGPEALLPLLQQLLASPSSSGQQAALAGVLTLAAAASSREEEIKCKLMDGGFVEAAVKGVLDSGSDVDVPAALLVPAAAVLRSVTTGDDERVYASKAFMHARLLAKTCRAHKVMLGLLGRLVKAGPADTAAAAEEGGGVACVVSVMTCLRQLAANDDLCKELGDEGAADLLLALLRDWCGRGRDMVCAAANLLRQLANSDVLKKAIASKGGVEVALQVIAAHARQEEVLEAALGLLVSMSLRQPDISSQVAEAGCADLLMEVMADNPRAGPVLRQACMLIRNMVVRVPELRALFLERGAEAALRAAKAAHPASCKDVGSAALRDLGLDNYQ